jgi:hypothetical protein
LDWVPPVTPIRPSHLPWRPGHHLPQGGRRGRERRLSPRTRSRQTKLRREPGSPFCLVEQGYGVCGARDERAHAGQQQQLVDQLGHDVLPRSGSGKTTTGSRNFGSATACGPLGFIALMRGRPRGAPSSLDWGSPGSRGHKGPRRSPGTPPRLAFCRRASMFPTMLLRTLPAGFIAPCLPTKTDKLRPMAV